MLHLPDPLHPFAVHFPVAFLLAGSACIPLSLLWPNRNLLRLAALFMVLGALGSVWAHRTGMEEAQSVRFVTASAAEAVQAHKNVSVLMLVASWIAAVAAVASVLARPLPGLSLAARLVAVAAVVFLLWTMQAAHHTGSEVTHRHFFGPNAPRPPLGTEEVIRLKVE